MIFDFGPLIEFIDITAQYSNAVLVAVLPYVGSFSQDIALRQPGEFTTNSVSRMVINPKQNDFGVSIWFTNGFVFRYGRGHVTSFFGPGAYSKERDYRHIPNYFGPVKMNKKEAVELARGALKKLGYPLELVFADMEPDVKLPERVGKSVIPYYEIQWVDPRGGKSVFMEVNANKKTFERTDFSCGNLSRAPFTVNLTPSTRPNHPLYGTFAGINPEYGYTLFPIVMQEVANCSVKLGIALSQPLTTNHIRRFFVGDNGGWPHSELELTNGARFIYRNTNVVGYFAPDEFWNSDKRKILVADFKGSWRMTDREMIELARQTLAKLGYPKDFVHTEDKPELLKPKGQFEKLIPRCKIEWMYPNAANMTQWAYVEVDADKRQIKSIYFDDESFRELKPSIAVPISLGAKQ